MSAKRIETNGEIQILKTGGLPLGMSEEQFALENGDVLILMTDGIIEALDSDDNFRTIGEAHCPRGMILVEVLAK